MSCMEAQGPIIRFAGVGKQYNGHAVLRDINLNIDCHEFLTVIGASGSGKTTLLKMINGLVVPDRGRVLVGDQDIAAMPEAERIRLRRRMGYAVQGVGLFPHLSVAGNMAYTLRLLGVGKAAARERLAELCAIVGLDQALLQRRPADLSGGQQQRVGIARALAAAPGIVLMDEPFGAVDAITRAHLQDEILRIHAALGMTVIFVTHDVDEALKLGSRVLVVAAGGIEQHDAPEILLRAPRTPYVAELLGARAVPA